MASRIYTGVRDKARKVKAIYIGVGNKARSVKAVYIGVNGKARLCWKRPGVYKYAGTVSNHSLNRYGMCGGSIGNYALFAGGAYYNTTNKAFVYSTTIDTYNSSLTKTSVVNLSIKRDSAASETTVNHVLFAGGYDSTASTKYLNIVDGYDTTLSRSSITRLSVGRADCAATYVAPGIDTRYALFAGGVSSASATTNTIDIYNRNSTLLTTMRLSENKVTVGACNGSAIFAGGKTVPSVMDPVYTDTVDAFNTILTSLSVSKLTEARDVSAAGSVGRYALFAGGSTNSNDYTTTVEAYDDSLTKTTLSSGLSVAVGEEMCSASINGYLLFAGGEYRTASYTTVVNVYDKHLTRTTSTKLRNGRYNASSVVGNYALFAGGYGNKTYPTAVDAYEVYTG